MRKRGGQITHGQTHNPSPEFYSWKAMKARCYSPSASEYHRYGARGIKVCDRWRNSFTFFLEDMGPKPSPKHTLDRYPDKNGNYEPGNVRWATPIEQANNRRLRRKQAEPRTGSKKRLALEAGIPYTALLMRLRAGWSVEEAVKIPVGRKQGPGGLYVPLREVHA